MIKAKVLLVNFTVAKFYIKDKDIENQSVWQSEKINTLVIIILLRNDNRRYN